MAMAQCFASDWFTPARLAVSESQGLRSTGREKRVRAAPSRKRQLVMAYYFWLSWKRLFTSAQFTTFHHSLR
jgi:hypothetical protein